MVDRGDERIGDEDRSAVVDLLRGHTGAGRLGLDEFEELVGEVYAARTRAELAHVLDGLPAGVAPSPPPPAPPLVPDRFAGSSGSTKSSKPGAFASFSAPARPTAPPTGPSRSARPHHRRADRWGVSGSGVGSSRS